MSGLLGFALLTLTATTAAPQWTSSEEAYRAGRAAYEAKRYEDAAEAFKATYAHDPNPVLLVNVAESYKRAGDCVQALAYYERFLKAVPNGDLNITITGRAAALRPKCPAPFLEAEPGSEARLAASKAQTPPKAPPAAPTPPPTSAEARQPVDRAEPKVALPTWQIGLEAGATSSTWGTQKNLRPSVRLQAERAFWWGPLGLSVGLSGQWGQVGYKSAPFAPGPYEAQATAWEGLAQVSGRLQVAEWLLFRVDAGGGFAWVEALKPWNELGEDGASTGGGGLLPAMRTAIGVEVPLTAAIALRATPVAFSWVQAPRGHREGAGARWALTASAGLSYGF